MALTEREQLDLLELEMEFGNQQAPQKMPEKGFLDKLLNPVSPLTLGQRARFSMGNPEGILDYLKKQGIDGEYRNGELFIGRGENAVPADPNGINEINKIIDPRNALKYFDSMDAVTHAPLNIASDAASGFMTANKFLRDSITGNLTDQQLKNVSDVKSGIKNSVGDLVGDVADAPGSIMNMVGSSLGGIGGAAAGAATGPASLVLGPAGLVVGSGVGAGATEKVRQKIGEGLDVYKTKGEFFTPEMTTEAAVGALSAVPGAAFQGGKGILKAIADKGLKWKVPERIFASGTGMGAEFTENPNIITKLLKDNATGTRKQLQEFSSKKLQEVYGPQINSILEKYPGVNLDDILKRIESANFPSKMESGSRETAKDALSGVVDEFKALFKGQADDVLAPKTIDLKSLNAEKSRLGKAASSVYDNPDIKAQITAKAKKEVADASREAIYQNVGDDAAALRAANQDYHTYDSLKDSVEGLIEKSNKQPLKSKIGLTDLGVGGGALAASGGVAGGAAIAAKKALETTYAQTKAASWLYKLLNAAPKTGFNAQAQMPVQQAIQQLVNDIQKRDLNQ